MKDFFDGYFYATKSELRGVTLLIFIILVISVTRFFVNAKPSGDPIDMEEFRAKYALIQAANSEDKEGNKEWSSTNESKNHELFYFNPNESSKTEFEKLGLSSRTAQSIINYRNKGGKFFKPEDFKKIYTLDTEDYNRLLPYIAIDKNDKFQKYPKKYADDAEQENSKPVELFRFNPNMASKSDLERLGLSGRTAQSIINYRNKGGKFFKPTDFKKIYTLSESDYNRLEDYIDIPKKEKIIKPTIAKKENNNIEFSKNPKLDYIKKSSTIKIDINTAKVKDLQQLKGIGEGYAKRIIKYRTTLGGFSKIEQIGEVYGLPPETYKAIETQLTLKSKKIATINLNTATYQDLAKHPYIDSRRANAIINYRKQHGNFKSVNDLKKLYAISADLFKKIKPYLSV